MTCQKIPYPTKQVASKTAATIRVTQRGRQGVIKKAGKKQRPYECAFCGNWHLTTQKKWRKRS